MSEPKDPAIKLFGRTIPLPEKSAPCGASGSGGGFHNTNPGHQDQDPPPKRDVGNDKSSDDGGGRCGSGGDCDGGDDGEDREGEKEIDEENIHELKQEDGENSPEGDAASTSGQSGKPETPNPESTKTKEEQNNGVCQETKLKKPDKILPCPRCNSMDTKFCYYNNYNINQPRHFCKNCHRYWTAGGTMRNVPVGAGRRKNKNSASHYHRIAMSADNLQDQRIDLLNGVHHPNHNTSMLAFGSDALLCESMASGLNLADKATRSGTRNGFHKPEDLKIQIPCGNPNISPNPPNEQVGISSPSENSLTFLQKVPCFAGAPPWQYPWNTVPWTVLPVYPPPAYWSAVPPGFLGNFPWMAYPTSPFGSGPNSPTLGKHSRDENVGEPGNSEEDKPVKEKGDTERNLWVPKTLRIDDPGQAAKSSIWETLGIKYEKSETFRAFRPNKEEKSRVEENSNRALQANPAALSRSVKFQESS